MQALDARARSRKCSAAATIATATRAKPTARRDGGQIEETAAHQWNICAEPG